MFNNSEKYVMIVSHRGDWIHAPENSLKAIKYLIDYGVDVVEVDVRVTKEGVPVLMHDLTLDRTTTGSGLVSDFSVSELKDLYLKDALGVVTRDKIPTLEEVMIFSSGKIFVYLDKSHGVIDKILPVLSKTKTLEQSIFVLNYPYEIALAKFGKYLNNVVYIPVVEDSIINLSYYIDEYLMHYNPKAFQFRMSGVNTKTYKLMGKIKSSSSKIFIAATWKNHSAGHDDGISRVDPHSGWGWLISEGVSIIETNSPCSLLTYLKENSMRN